MDRALVDRIARSVLYEGNMLYPYRRSSIKNAKRFLFGTLYPESWVAANGGADRSYFHAELLFSGPRDTRVSILGRYLLNDAEREVVLESTVSEHCSRSFTAGELRFCGASLADGLHKLTVVLRNTSDLETSVPGLEPENSLAAAHAVISISEGELISLTDPPPLFAGAALQCVNTGVWPVLIGEAGAHDAMLAAPIILPDYPEVAPESAGDLCDATEIEEILTLRILTLTEEEKAEVRASGDRAREILDRAESLPAEHLMKLHGTIRGLSPAVPERWSEWDNWANAAVVEKIHVGGADLKAGDRVRLRPGKRADIFDTALAGRTAVIAGIEQDFEDKVHVAVVVDDDPGRDLGEMRQTGHRFFFSPEEIELP